ncbi:NAD(P)-dependent oxidoreductase [uncultured Pseudokineococcus sp.]|uniref:NAD(P)-dependent oxidoreductase n=1 Tax=uncultured Pseudokineococcus sp. TaxID=1642928 RepID=UPI002618BB24|nr:NAD(P)-dependent oxidoreductase [uncultured Pseudokineococcus sp.]
MTLDPTSTSVGFVGLGNIGAPMVRALLAADWSVTVHDTRRERVEEVVGAGATAAADVGELAGCDVLLLAVPDDAAVEAVLSGQGGAGGWLSHERPERLVVVHSTVLPDTAVRLAEVAAQRGVALLDAPVSGGADRAEKGDLTIFVGSEPEALAAARPLLEAEGSRVVHLGPPGAGAATKLANQLMMLSALAGAQEGMDLAAAHGVPEAALLDAVSTCTGDTWVSRNWSFFDRTVAAYDAAGTSRSERPWSKDLFEVVEAARAADLRVPVAALLSQVLADRVEAHAAGGGAKNGGGA